MGGSAAHCWGPCSPGRPCPPALDEHSRAPGMVGPVVWALTPGPPLGRPPSALRAHLKTNGQVTAEGSRGSQPGRVAANTRLICALPPHVGDVPVGLQLRQSPGCPGSWVGIKLLDKRGVLTVAPSCSGGRMDGWVGGWGPE